MNDAASMLAKSYSVQGVQKGLDDKLAKVAQRFVNCCGAILYNVIFDKTTSNGQSFFLSLSHTGLTWAHDKQSDALCLLL